MTREELLERITQERIFIMDALKEIQLLNAKASEARGKLAVYAEMLSALDEKAEDPQSGAAA